MKMRPVMFVWTDDGTMRPLDRFLAICDRQFAVGAEYPLMVVEARNMKSHNHYFACIHTAWENLPEKYARRFPTEEALRAKALVETNWCHERDYACDSPAKAKSLAAIIRNHSEYAVIKISGSVVKVFDPKSQSVPLMSAEDFKQSKEDVLDWIEALNPGLKIRDVKKEAARVALPEKRPSLSRSQKPVVAPTGPLPDSAPAYFAYARTWIFAAKDEAEARERYEAERDLRDRLKVSIPNRREIEGMLDRQFQQTEPAR